MASISALSKWWLRFRRFSSIWDAKAVHSGRRRLGEAHDGAILGTTLHINLKFFFAYFQVLDLLFLVLKFVNDNFRDAGPLKVTI